MNLTKRVVPHYNLLIDICFWVLFLYYLRLFLVSQGVPEWLLLRDVPVLNRIFWLMAVIVQNGAVLLILFGRLRDEYAERLWRQAASTYVKFVLISPFLWGPLLVYLDRSGTLAWYGANPQELFLPLGIRMPNPGNSTGILQLEAINFLVAKLFAFLPLLFTGCYKWHRWRDER